MRQVLDDDLLDGIINAEIRLRPARSARVLSEADWEEAVAAVTLTCQYWGGAADLFVPVDDEQRTPTGYENLVRASELDGASGVASAWVPAVLDAPMHQRLPTLLALATSAKDRLKTLRSCQVRPEDPWHLSYLAALGQLPPAPDPSTLEALRLHAGLRFEDFVRYQQADVDTPGVDDLVKRLTSASFFTPVQASRHALRSKPATTTHAASDGWLADPATYARQQGPDIVVVYTPGSVSDLCLLWNLRALHGWPSGLPLGIPWTGDTKETASWIEGLRDLPGHLGFSIVLTSASVDSDTLAELSRLLPSSGPPADTAAPEQLLVPAMPPARSSQVPLAFNKGAATVATRTDRDRADLEILERLGALKPDLRVSVRLSGVPMVPTQSLNARFNGAFSGGARIVTANTDGLRTFNWPSGMTMLRALAADRAVTATPSPSGRSAMALLSALGSVSNIAWLAHRPLLQLLYRKAGSSGMTWWKARAREQSDAVANASEDPDAALADLMAAIERVSVSHGGESAATVTFSELCGVLGGKTTAGRWLAWAERRSLLIRGTTVTCPHCIHTQWRTLDDIAPPLTCIGCGQSNDRPFNESSLNFTYRLGEPLRRCLEDDSIHHLLTLRTLRDILAGSPDGLVGLHPGVDFTRDGQKAEADVVVVLASGAVIPVEVKARSVGLLSKDLNQLDLLAGWFDSQTVILATSDSDDQLHPDFAAAAQTKTTPWRRLLTGEDLYARSAPASSWMRPPETGTGLDCAVGPRPKTEEDLDAEFISWLRAAGDLDSVTDPTAAILPSST